jgi:glucose/mannose-6-phosphate isomerase
MDKMIAGFPTQLAEALVFAEKIVVRKHTAPYRNVFITGLGASGIGGNFVQELVRETAKVPVVVSKGYDIPRWVNRHTLAICSSYSGNTEETLSAFQQLCSAHAKIVCVATGGELLEQAQALDLDTVQLPVGAGNPNTHLGYSLVAQLAILQAAKLISGRLAGQVEIARKLLVKNQPAMQKEARKIATHFFEKNPVLYLADHMEAVALRWRQQLNEQAKVLCWHHVAPEMSHNEILGWRGNRPDVAVLWLRNRDDFSRTAVRLGINREIVEYYTNASLEVWSKGKSLTEKMLYLTHLGDWTAFYLAELRGFDPNETKVIDYLKGELAQFGASED